MASSSTIDMTNTRSAPRMISLVNLPPPYKLVFVKSVGFCYYYVSDAKVLPLPRPSADSLTDPRRVFPFQGIEKPHSIVPQLSQPVGRFGGTFRAPATAALHIAPPSGTPHLCVASIGDLQGW